eukprot:g11680.t2
MKSSQATRRAAEVRQLTSVESTIVATHRQTVTLRLTPSRGRHCLLSLWKTSCGSQRVVSEKPKAFGPRIQNCHKGTTSQQCLLPTVQQFSQPKCCETVKVMSNLWFAMGESQGELPITELQAFEGKIIVGFQSSQSLQPPQPPSDRGPQNLPRRPSRSKLSEAEPLTRSPCASELAILKLLAHAFAGPSSHDAALGSLFHTSCDHGSPTNLWIAKAVFNAKGSHRQEASRRAEYFYRDEQRSPLTYYHNRSPKTGDTVLVGATDPRAREARTIDNYAKERTRGFAVQIILEGRGVKAYWEPKAPFLKARLGVGAKVIDITEYVKRDPDIQVNVSKKGDLLVLHGPNKARVGTLAYRLLKKLQPRLQVYTGKGAHFAFHPAKRKRYAALTLATISMWRWHPCCSRVWLRRTLRLRTGFVRSVADRMNCPDATVPFLRFLVGHFATLGYTDAHLRHGTLGRLQDVTSDASPRRVLRLMRAMTTLRWPAKELLWV